MGLLYEQMNGQTFAYVIFILFALMAFNELARSTKWAGLTLFLIVPIGLTIFVWPKTAAFGNPYGTGTWFNWVKTYSCLAGSLGFMALRYHPKFLKNKWIIAFPAFILAVNILEACIRDFQVYSYGLFNGGIVDNLWTMSGPWNIMNGIAGLLNICLICGWSKIFISKDKTKDMMYPDMTWIYVITYDLWNFAYTYNCISDHSMYCGVILLLSCTIPAFFIKKGMWLQHRASTLGLWIMFVMTVPSFAEVIAKVPTTHNPYAFFIVSLISLLANLIAFIYHIYRIKTKRLNPFKDQIYEDFKSYQTVIKEN